MAAAAVSAWAVTSADIALPDRLNARLRLDHPEKDVELTIDDERHGDALVLHLTGRLDTATSKSLDDHITLNVARGQRTIVLDLAKIDYVSSYGLRVS